MKRVVTIIQARVSSTRFPKKILMPLGGVSLLQRMLERVRAAKLIGKLVVATTIDPQDDIIEQLAANENIDCFRGDRTDLLDRHYKTALAHQAEAVVKIPSDCPLIDPEIIDKVLYYYLSAEDEFDYVSNLHPATYPDGNDVEIFSMAALTAAWQEAKRDFEREHTTPFIWENQSRFSVGNVVWESGLDLSMSHRWTIDYPEDYEFIKTVFDRLYAKNPLFKLTDILDLLVQNPEIKQINQHYCGVNWYRYHMEDLKTISQTQTKQIYL